MKRACRGLLGLIGFIGLAGPTGFFGFCVCVCLVYCVLWVGLVSLGFQLMSDILSTVLAASTDVAALSLAVVLNSVFVSGMFYSTSTPCVWMATSFKRSSPKE